MKLSTESEIEEYVDFTDVKALSNADLVELNKDPIEYFLNLVILRFELCKVFPSESVPNQVI